MYVSFYENVYKTSGIPVELTGILKAIKNGKWKDKVESYRETGEGKETTPAVTVSGKFENARKASQLTDHSGFIAMDFDNIDDIEQLENELRTDKYTYSLFRSISGNGLCAIVKIDGKKHKDAFKSLEAYYLKHYSVGIDPSCKDVSRLRIISYDPNLYLNPESEKFENYLPKKKGRKPKIKPTFSTDDDVEYVIKQIEAKRIDITSNYSEWVELAFALYSEYGDSGEEYFHRISQFHPEYDERKTSIKYRSARGGGSVSINTFFHYAKKNGLEIVTSKTRTIQRAATYARKGGRTEQDVIKQLQEVDDIPKEKAEPVVKKIFESKEAPDLDDDDDLVGQVEDFLKRERQIKYNEVTLKYQEKGKPLVDRDMNSVYLDAKKIIPKANKDLVFSVIDSDRTPTINPLKDFFKKNSHRDPKSAIKELAESIDTPTGLTQDNFCPNFTEIFLRKWLIGSVAMWHGAHSPLMFVLAGNKQNTGKTHFFRYLLPDSLQPYYAEAELTGDKDENLLMCSKAILMNDEMSNKSRRDITVMKKLCSVQWFNLRRPYGKSNEDIRRIATLAGTSNNIEILSDPTGNRRIIPIEVNSIDHDKYNNVDKTDLWMEAYHGYMGGEAYQLNQDDIKLLNDNTNEFEEPSPEAELVMKFFRKPGDGESKEYLTNTEIKSYCEVRTNQRLNSRKLGLELTNMGYEKSIKRIEGKVKQVYSVVVKDDSGIVNKVKF